MKKLIWIALSAGFIMACNNDSANTGKDDDTAEYKDTKVIDPAAETRGGDTASYERLPNKINDSTPR
jgi:hypothetical protein